MTLLVDISGLTVRRGTKVLLQDVNLTLSRGEIVTVIGPNGAGKTTLVRVLLGLAPPSTGRLVRAPGLRIGYMPQSLQLGAQMPLTVARFLRLAGCSADDVTDAMQVTDTAHLARRAMVALSGGETQRVLLARALLRRPDLLVLDEPVQGVDVAGQDAMYRLILRLRDQLGCGVLMVSHDLHLVMANTDKVLCLNTHVCCQGHPDEVSAHPEYLQLFGRPTAMPLAVYTHHHDHVHGDAGCGSDH